MPEASAPAVYTHADVVKLLLNEMMAMQTFTDQLIRKCQPLHSVRFDHEAMLIAGDIGQFLWMEHGMHGGSLMQGREFPPAIREAVSMLHQTTLNGKQQNL